MADQFNEFDRVFRDRLRDQTAIPPDSVWNNIQTERSFGHIIANKISSSWRIIGTLLLLAMAGGTSALLMNKEDESTIQVNTHAFDQQETLSQSQELTEESKLFTASQNELTAESSFVIETNVGINDQLVYEDQLKVESDLLASNSDFGFGRPDFGDSRLAILLDDMDGWGSAKV